MRSRKKQKVGTVAEKRRDTLQSGIYEAIGSRMLTARQRFVFDSAMNEGYWESPRRITLSA